MQFKEKIQELWNSLELSELSEKSRNTESEAAKLEVRDEVLKKQADVKLQILNLSVSRDSLESSIKSEEAAMKYKISEEKTEDGKKAFTNDNARKAEFVMRASSDEGYLGLQSDLASVELELEVLMVAESYLRGLFQSLLAIRD